MSLVIDLSPEATQRLHDEAARVGQTPDECARRLLEERLAVAHVPERNRRAIELLRSWRNREPDWEEAEGYPETISPLSLREIKID